MEEIGELHEHGLWTASGKNSILIVVEVAIANRQASTIYANSRSVSVGHGRVFKLDVFNDGAANVPLDERLANYIIEGTRDGLIADLERKRGEGAPPLDIVNGPLMAGMAVVGPLFNANELIVAEVSKSAEPSNGAGDPLEPLMGDVS